MRWPDVPQPTAMRRVAVVAPKQSWADVLAAVADRGVFEPDLAPSDAPDAASDDHRGRGDRGDQGTTGPTADAVAAELRRVSAGAISDDDVTALAGWMPVADVGVVAECLEPLGGSVVELPWPAGAEVPTLLPERRGSAALRPLVDTYATVPYRDLDPIWFAAAAYVVMFGMMFGDVGDGLLLVAGGLLLRRARSPRLRGVRPMWPFIVTLGVSATVFGLLYGECFGPTGIVPALWMNPLDDPELLLVVAIGVGAVLLAAAYVLAIVNRWREAGPGAALWAPAGIAGAAVFAGIALVAGGVVGSEAAVWGIGLVVAGIGLGLAAVGLHAEAGHGTAAGMQTGIELFDLVLRVGSNLVSFARLAAFGLTHAALGLVVWDATTSLWHGGGVGYLAAALVFVIGRVITFALEALVAGVQALRLEYYELFSRVFVGEGRPFRPWHVPVGATEEKRC